VSADETTEFAERYGPWAVIAGGSEGLGAEFAKGLAERGINLVLLARRQTVLDQVAAAMNSIKQVSVQNAEGIRQVQTAAQNLQAVGHILATLVEQFVLAANDEQSVAEVSTPGSAV